MSKKDYSYDDRLYEGNRMGCWGFAIVYFAVSIASIFKGADFDIPQIAGLTTVVIMLYEITRAHSNIENIIERYRSEMRKLDQENYDLKNKVRDLEWKLRNYE